MQLCRPIQSLNVCQIFSVSTRLMAIGLVSTWLTFLGIQNESNVFVYIQLIQFFFNRKHFFTMWKNKKDKATRGIVQYCSQWPKWDQNDKWSKWDQMKFSRSRSEIFLRGVFTVCAVTLETKTQWTCKWARAIVESHHTVNAEIVLLVVMTSAEIDSVVVLKRNDVIVQKKLVRLRSAINRAWQSDQWPREENRHELDNKELVTRYGPE